MKIDRNLFGQFAEHLGTRHLRRDLVGSDSKIPNSRGIRNDVVAALKAIHVPNVRWPGGCFADEYHWRDGIGLATSREVEPQLGRRDRAEHLWDARIHGLHRPDRERGLRLGQPGIGISSRVRSARVHDGRAGDDVREGARRENIRRPTKSHGSGSAMKAGTAAAT